MSDVTLTVDLAALAANYSKLAKASAPGTCGAVVKANGYGLGARACAARLAQSGCQDFFVATTNEAIEVRAELPGVRVFVLGGISKNDTDGALEHGLIPVVNDASALERWRVQAGHPLAIQVDTGMNRLGFTRDAFASANLSGLHIVLLMTHLACADEPHHPANARQRARFAELLTRLPGVPLSLSSSAGILSHGGGVREIGRPGIALYGGNPFATQTCALARVATFDAPVLQMRDVVVGDEVGYGATYVADRARRIAVVGAGYADGVPRLLSNRGAVAFGAQRLPIVGRVSMDLTTIDASEAPDLRVGDRVSFFGGAVALEEVAAWAETISYEILTGIGPRVVRRYLN